MEAPIVPQLDPLTIDTQLSLMRQETLLRKSKVEMRGDAEQPEEIDGEYIVVKENSKFFTVLLNPEKKTWLKLAMRPSLNNRLEKSGEAMKSSVELSGQSAVDIKMIDVGLNGSQDTFRALQMPHLGVSLELLLRSNVASKRQASEIYLTGYMIALALARRGFLFADPNPGNILMSDGKCKGVTLIDFTNDRIYTNSSNLITEYLTHHFTKQTNIANIPFDQNMAQLIRDSMTR
jgi:hypothetical protein